MSTKKKSSPPAPPVFTTGLVACVWHRNQRKATETAAVLRAAEIEFRLEQAATLLATMEERAREAVAKVERAQQRFAQLSQSLLLLRREWKDFLKETKTDNDQEEK